MCFCYLSDCSQRFHHFVSQDTTGDEEEDMADEEDEGDEDDDEEGEANPGRNAAVVRPACLNTKSPMWRNALKEHRKIRKVTAPWSSHDYCSLLSWPAAGN